MQFVIDIALSLIYFCAFLLICAWSWRFWKLYINQKHLNGIDWVVLEIKLPREIMKSPYATEVAISSLLQTGGVSTWHHLHIRGSLPIYASLEIASIEGVIHFYIRAQRRFRPIIESNFYAQYPGIEIIEAEDYTALARYEHRSNDVSVWGSSFRLGGKWSPWNPEKGEKVKDELKADFLPIKTYVDYELDKNPKEEFKIDPIAPLLEFMGSIGKGEHFWYQIILQPESVYDGKKLSKFYTDEKHNHISLADMAKKYKKDLRIESFSEKGTVLKGKIEQNEKGEWGEKKYPNEAPVANTKKEMELTAEDKDTIEAINKKFSKPLAVCVIRLLYLSDNKKAKFDNKNVFNILSFPKPFEGANKLGPKTTTDPYDYPWQNFRNRRVPWRSEEFFEAYVEREAFYPHTEDRDWLAKMEDNFFWGSSMRARKIWRMFFEAFLFPFHHPSIEAEANTLNLEEIATLWHLPGAVVTTPTLPRIDSAKAVAPVNLPQ